jgi:hypothetical protein
MSDAAGSLPSPGDDQKVLAEQLTRAWSLRTNQDQVLWRVFGALWPTNAILLAALFRSGQQVPSRAVGISIAETLERMLALKPEHALSVGLSSIPVRQGPQARAVMRNCGVTPGVSA